jgi:hypothetical protein
VTGIARGVSNLFFGKSPVSVSLRHFAYTGELQKIGLLAKLATSVPQTDLSLDVKEVGVDVKMYSACRNVPLLLGLERKAILIRKGKPLNVRQRKNLR